MNGVVSAGNKKDSRNGNASVSGSQKDLRTMSGSQKDVRNGNLSASSSQRDLQNGGGSVNGSQRDLRINSGDGDDEKYRGKFTGKSTLKNPFGSSTTLSSTAPTENSGDDLDDHINVVLRVRPANGQERDRKDQLVTKFHGEGRVEVDHVSVNRSFVYNVVFEPEALQEDVFDHSGVKKLIDMSINGYACTAFAFGQTGSGKTHTMTGPPQQVIDLLNTNHRRYLNVRWSKNKGFYVENLFIVECETVDDLMAVLEEDDIHCECTKVVKISTEAIKQHRSNKTATINGIDIQKKFYFCIKLKSVVIV
ncbi:KIF12 [Mytilus edulis]|uniref:KIF12 n=1 Tax=Mytilus edulis TaxID=6550 RepID=A0A8S3R6D3_MYTED|nr:KIF12 [Mytilus edulis]